jgi:PAS domain S-box-containing protein
MNRDSVGGESTPGRDAGAPHPLGDALPDSAWLEVSPVAIVVLDGAGRVRRWNPKAEALVGNAGAPLATRLADPSAPETGIVQGVLRAAREGLPAEIRCMNHAGAQLVLRISATTLRDAQGGEIGTIGVVDDVTSSRRAERRLAAQHAATQVLAQSTNTEEALPALLRAICESLDWELGVLWRADEHGQGLRSVASWGNPDAIRPDQVAAIAEVVFPAGVGVVGRVFSERRALWYADIAAVADAPARPIAALTGLHAAFGFPVIVRGGVAAVFGFLSREIRAPDEAVLSMFASIGAQVGQFLERKRVEEERDTFFKVSLEMLCILGVDGTLRRLNPAWERTLGHTAEELAAAPITHFVHPEDRDATRAELGRLARGVDTTFFEHRFRAKDGSYRWLSWTCPGAQSGQGLLYAAVRDVTERKQTEEALRQGEEQLRQSQKMEATGRLAGWTAHYFNNLLTAILGYSRLLLGRLPGGDPLREYAKQIQSAGERTASLTQQLLAFSRRQAMRPALLDLNGVVADMDRMLSPLIGEDVELSTVLAPRLDPVRADRGQLEQVLLNLVLNARDALPEGGRITVSTALVTLDDVSARRFGSAPPGRFVALSVEDTGVGMDAETRARVFEPFFTTKRLGQGTGLGLSMVYGIVQQTGGFIRVESEPAVGSRFEVIYPALSPDAAAGGRTDAREPQTILLVEDEDAVRELTGEVLRGAGYTILEARSADEALRLARSHDGPIDLLLTDVVMPGTNGRQLARALTAEREHIKVLYMSGYAAEAVARYGVGPGDAFLPKPFTPDSLESKVREALGASTPSRSLP